MIEAIVISLVVGLAAAHVAFRLSPKLTQRKMRDFIVMGLSKFGFHALAQRLLLIPRTENKACGSGCDGCGTQAGGDELKVDGGEKVVQFHPRLR
jgi:hypothetical protein